MNDQPLDRASRQLTSLDVTSFGRGGPGGYVPPLMRRAHPPPPRRDSIFGDTYGGVPNPNVPVVHGYPTRFHGPIFTVPQAGYTYVPKPYTLAPFLGFEDKVREFSVTGNSIADALIGAAAGYVAAPSKDRALVYAGAGAAAMGFLGTVGLIGILGLGLWEAQRAGNVRPDIHKKALGNV